MYLTKYRRKKNGVPILSKAEIDTLAERHIYEFNPQAMQEPMEIDIDSFVLNYLGCKQDFQYLSNNGIYLGMTVFNDTNKVPVYNPETNTAEYISAKARTIIIDNNLLAEDQEYRYRYTMGHEAGHDIFHKKYFGYDPNQLTLFNEGERPLIQCRAVNYQGKSKPVYEWTDIDTMEWQANYISAALLMPRSMVTKLADTFPNVESEFRDPTVVMEVSRIFNVSPQAGYYRLLGLGLVKSNSLLESEFEKLK